MIYAYIFVMAGVTYLIRMIPLALLRRPLRSRFLRSFLYYVPYACLSAMTFPAILSSTAGLVSALAGFAAAVFLALRGKGLLVVAVWACAAVFVAERILSFIA